MNRRLRALARLSAALGGGLLLWACDGTENSCVSQRSSREAGVSSEIVNSCSYQINVMYCRIPAGRSRADSLASCAKTLAEPGAIIAKTYTAQPARIEYGACRAPQTPYAQGNRFACK